MNTKVVSRSGFGFAESAFGLVRRLAPQLAEPQNFYNYQFSATSHQPHALGNISRYIIQTYGQASE
jgi:hypothetical protein